MYLLPDPFGIHLGVYIHALKYNYIPLPFALRGFCPSPVVVYCLTFLVCFFFFSSLISSLIMDKIRYGVQEAMYCGVFLPFEHYLESMKLFLILALCSCLYVSLKSSWGPAAAFCTSDCGLSSSLLPFFFFFPAVWIGRDRRSRKERCHPLFMESRTGPIEAPFSAPGFSLCPARCFVCCTCLEPLQPKELLLKCAQLSIEEKGLSALEVQFPDLLALIIPGRGILHLAQIMRPWQETGIAHNWPIRV